MPDRYRALVLVTAFASLRWGEVTAPRRADVDLGQSTVSVRVAYTELPNGALVLGPPKSPAGARTVSLPAAVVKALTDHMAAYVGEGRDALVFSGPKGVPVGRSNFNKLVRWAEAVEAVGQPGLRFHDLRHTGATLAARTGTALRDLMQRIGHDSTAAAIRYQHASREADEIIAAALDDVIKASRDEDDDEQDDGDDGAAGVVAR